jgi:biotin transport system substrate-specific component
MTLCQVEGLAMDNAGTAISRHPEKHAGVVPWTRPAFLAIGVTLFVLLTFWGARIAVPLPGTPVPATLQTLPVLMAGLFLGAGPGCLSQIIYVALGFAGAPVFALPGAGPAYLLGPTGGYLAGFIAAAFIVGRVASGAGAGLTRRLGALLFGLVAIHLCGFAGLLPHVAGDAGTAWRAGVLPFALFDAAKVVGALALHASWLALMRRFEWRTGSRS